ncbi:MAG: hypothetical protein ACLFV6_00640 [Spirulinaceae cyanobacterium]
MPQAISFGVFLNISAFERFPSGILALLRWKKTLSDGQKSAERATIFD